MSNADWGERFAEPRATKPVPLGPCKCPGTPHGDGDTGDVRVSVGASEARSAYGAGVRYHADGTSYWDEAVGDDTAIARFTTWWNLVDKKRKPIPIDLRSVALLDQGTRDLLLEPINAMLRELFPAGFAGGGAATDEGSLPNAPGAGSAASSRRKRSPRQAAGTLT